MSAVRRAAQRGGIKLKLLLALVAVSATVALAWMLLLPGLVTAQLRQRTGFEANVASLMVNPFTGRIVARGFVLNNPPTFPRAEFLQVRSFEAEAEMFTLFTDKPVFTRVVLDVGLLALVRRPDGKTNAGVFQNYLLEDVPGPALRRTDREKPPRAFLIRRLEVRFDRLLIADHTRREPAVNEYPLKLERTFTDITDSRQLVLPGSLDELFALGRAVGTLLPEDASQALDRAMRSGTDTVRELTRRNRPVMPGFTDALEESKKP